MIDTRATTVFDHTGSGSALFSVKVGVDIDGTYCDAGMTIAAIAEVGQPVITRIGFNANQFVILSGPGGKSYSPFSVINGQVFINEAFINYAGMTLAKVGSWYSANYVPGQSGTIMRNDGSFELNGCHVNSRVSLDSKGLKVFDNGQLAVELGIFD
ncbi:phage tail tip fiber protein [Sodalis glossinidius]|uniref:phage tail tip fiber protein n=1 Tax=Sodalis glossinidius TaxID=63612 RepID=UPI003C76B538